MERLVAGGGARPLAATSLSDRGALDGECHVKGGVESGAGGAGFFLLGTVAKIAQTRRQQGARRPGSLNGDTSSWRICSTPPRRPARCAWGRRINWAVFPPRSALIMSADPRSVPAPPFPSHRGVLRVTTPQAIEVVRRRRPRPRRRSTETDPPGSRNHPPRFSSARKKRAPMHRTRRQHPMAAIAIRNRRFITDPSGSAPTLEQHDGSRQAPVEPDQSNAGIDQLAPAAASCGRHPRNKAAFVCQHRRLGAGGRRPSPPFELARYSRPAGTRSGAAHEALEISGQSVARLLTGFPEER